MLQKILTSMRTAFNRQNALSTTVTLSAEQWYEVRRALERAVTRERNGLAGLARYPHFSEPGCVKERAQHSLNIQESVLKKIPS